MRNVIKSQFARSYSGEVRAERSRQLLSRIDEYDWFSRNTKKVVDSRGTQRPP